MTSVQSDVREVKQFMAGEWTGASSGGTFEDRDPFTGDVVALVPAGGAEDAERAIEAAAGAFPAWSQSLPAQRQAIFLKAADILESRRDEIVGLLARETGATFGFGMFQMSFVPGLLRQAAGRGVRAARPDHPLGPPGDARDGDPQAGRRRRRDRAVERRADPLGALDRGAARAREHRRAEAVGAVAGRRRADLGRDLQRGGPAGRRPEHRHARARRRRPDRRRARREPGGAPDQLHRLDGDRPPPRRGRRPPPQARAARARRASTR